jgi:hypothetical protein
VHLSAPDLLGRQALNWARRYRILKAETAERLEKLEPWMVDWLRIEANSTGYEQYCISPSKLEDIADAIEQVIGEDDAQD